MARPLHQDTAHGLCGGTEEVAPAVPAPVTGLHQPDMGLVDKCGGLECLAGFLAAELDCGDSAEFAVDDGDEVVGGLKVAPLDGVQDVRDFVHALPSTRQPEHPGGFGCRPDGRSRQPGTCTASGHTSIQGKHPPGYHRNYSVRRWIIYPFSAGNFERALVPFLLRVARL